MCTECTVGNEHYRITAIKTVAKIIALHVSMNPWKGNHCKSTMLRNNYQL